MLLPICSNIHEVFTVPPHSTWNPYGIHVSIWIPYGFHPFHMEYVWVMFQPFQDVRSAWNPHGMTMEWPNYRWNDGISIWNPHGMTMELATIHWTRFFN